MDGKLRSIPWLQGIFPAFGAERLAGPHANADDFASFSTFDLASHQTAQGISDVGAGNLKFGSREFLLAQRVWFEPSLEREKATESTTGIFHAPVRDWLRTPARPNTLESGPIGQSAWTPPKA
jgi:hypothetical protein